MIKIQTDQALARLYKWPLFRFVIVGASNTLLSFGLFHAALAVLGNVSGRGLISQGLSYAGGILWSYYWNRRWTFRSQQRVLPEIQRFVIAQVAFMLASSGLVGVAVDLLEGDPTLSWVAVMALITLLNYLVTKTWVFPQKRAR
jgi:putative flippase GtrA